MKVSAVLLASVLAHLTGGSVASQIRGTDEESRALQLEIEDVEEEEDMSLVLEDEEDEAYRALGTLQKKCYYTSYKCPVKKHKKRTPAHVFAGAVAIANRNSGTISLVDGQSLKTLVEETLPDNGEPMYFAQNPNKSELWVGDRANSRMVIYKMVGCEIFYDGYVTIRAGVFHSFHTQVTDVKYPILATVADIDNVITVHDMTTRRLLTVLERPQEAIDDPSKPHDVTVSGDYIIATFLGGSVNGYVATYKAEYPYNLIAVLSTAFDPHVAVRDDTNVFIAAQGGELVTASLPHLNVINSVPRPSPHGIFISRTSKYFYTTNIADGGNMAIDTWYVATGERVKHCPEVTTSNAGPHNIALSLRDDKIFVTHSSPNINSAFRVHPSTGCVRPYKEKLFETGLTPFGLIVITEPGPFVTCAGEH